jgi:DNA-binding NarL/FixJ family response regulator
MNRFFEIVWTGSAGPGCRAAGPLAAVFGGLKHAGPARQSLRPASQPLNHRELQILELMCEGKGNKEIADRMGLELSTVKWYGTRIFEKLGVRSRTQAIAKARSQGLFD